MLLCKHTSSTRWVLIIRLGQFQATEKACINPWAAVAPLDPADYATDEDAAIDQEMKGFADGGRIKQGYCSSFIPEASCILVLAHL